MENESSKSGYTILRIKRKRNEEPLDALGKSHISGSEQWRPHVSAPVIESTTRRKKSRPGLGLFQFAETVERKAWDNEGERKGLQVSSPLEFDQNKPHIR